MSESIPGSDPQPRLVTEIQRATHVLGVHLEAVFADLGLSQGEIHVLSLLADGGALTVSQLQGGVRHRPSTLTGILDRLTGRDLVRRLDNPADRRSYLIALTAAGTTAARRVIREMAALERRLSAAGSAGEIAALRRLLRQVGEDPLH